MTDRADLREQGEGLRTALHNAILGLRTGNDEHGITVNRGNVIRAIEAALRASGVEAGDGLRARINAEVMDVFGDTLSDERLNRALAASPAPEPPSEGLDAHADEFRCGQCGDWLTYEQLVGHGYAEGRDLSRDAERLRVYGHTVAEIKRAIDIADMHDPYWRVALAAIEQPR